MKAVFLQWLLLLMVMTWQMTSGVLLFTYPERDIGNYYTNMAVHESSVYLAENGKLSRLHVTDLSLNTSVGTCADTSVDCENVNKILLVNDSRIITCGTGNGGRCERRSGQLEVVVGSEVNQEERDVFVVSSNLKRPAVGCLLEGTKQNMAFGVTQGSPLISYGPLRDGPGDGYRYSISLRSSNFNILGYRALQFVHNEKYLIYYRHTFYFDGFVYFLTNQKKTLGDHNYVTKLISVCPNENSALSVNRIESYVDIMLTCIYNGIEFGLLQDVDFIEVGGIGKLVGVFSQGNDPESPSTDGAVCIFSMDDIRETISAARDDYIVSPGNEWARTSHYIRKHVSSLDHWFIPREYYRESDVSCGGSLARPTVGNKVLSSNASYHSDGRNSTMTKIKVDVKYGSILEVFVGTSDGKLLKMSRKYDKLHKYETQPSEDSGAVRAIHHGDNYYLVLTDRKLYKYGLSDCSEYTSCSDTMASLNPRCGWCVYRDRSSTKDACPTTDTWLSPLTECPKLTASPQGIHVNDANIQVTISIDNVVMSYHESYAYTCVFQFLNKDIKNTASRNGNKFTCEIPTVKVHELAMLQLRYNDHGTLAQTVFLFYSCAEFESCGECVATEGARCIWCHGPDGPYSCQRPSEPCTESNLTTTQKSECPSLMKPASKIYIHDGISTTVVFGIQHSEKISPPYTCEVNGRISLATATASFGDFSCSVQVSIESGKYINFELKIRYSTRFIALDDEFNTEVTVYRCSELGRTCSECRALIRPRYSCRWSAGCQYWTDAGGGTCPPPEITKVEPSIGPSKGNTDITISGREFGSSVSSIQSPVMIGGHKCTIRTVNTYENPDFEQPIPEMIICTTTPCLDTKIGQPLPVIVVVDNQTSSNLIFTYVTPALTGISPSKGPIAGDTEIILTGDHLGIGSKDRTKVDVGGLPCWSVNVTLSESSQQHVISCKTNYASTTTTAVVVLNMDEREYNHIKFDYVANPIIRDVLPNTGFTSGGTLLTVRGTYLNNAGRAEINTVYEAQKSTVMCVIESKDKALCTVPPAPSELKTDIINSETKHKRTSAILAFDGVTKTFNINYFVDPYIETFDKVMEIQSGGQTLIIQGTHLDLAARVGDYTVTVGIFNCAILNLTSTSLQCVILKESTTNSGLQEVNVTVGNINKLVGYVRYQKVEESNTILVVGSVIGVVLLLLIAGILIGVWMYRRGAKRDKCIGDNSPVLRMEEVTGGINHSNLGQQLEIGQNPRLETSDNPYIDLDPASERDGHGCGTTDPGPETSNNIYTDLIPTSERSEHWYGTVGSGPDTNSNPYMDLVPASDRDDHNHGIMQQRPDSSDNAYLNLSAASGVVEPTPDTTGTVQRESNTSGDALADHPAAPGNDEKNYINLQLDTTN